MGKMCVCDFLQTKRQYCSFILVYRLALWNKPVTNADHRFDAAAATDQFLTQAANVHVESPPVAVIIVAPNVVESAGGYSSN